jgi:hypothetical protein
MSLFLDPSLLLQSTHTQLSRPLRKPHNSKLTLMPHHILRNLLTGIPLFSAPQDREASYVSPCGVVRPSQGLFRHPLAVPYCGRGREGDIGKLMLEWKIHRVEKAHGHGMV